MVNGVGVRRRRRGSDSNKKSKGKREPVRETGAVRRKYKKGSKRGKEREFERKK